VNQPSLVEFYRSMLDMRHFEEACLEGVPTREIHGELHTGIGQEAIAAGVAPWLRREDALVSTHRNHLHGLAKGVDPRKLMAEIFERETGLCQGRGGHMHPFDPETRFSATGIVGSSIPIALGFAYAAQMEKSGAVAVAVAGDGASNTGAFHECLNMAGAWRLPLLVLVENNSYAISVRFDEVSATPTVAERASAYGAWGRRVDGTDVEAVYQAAAEAFDHMRGGHGPAILEATCHRFQGHYEGDHDTYRPREERKRMRVEHDPLTLAERRLTDSGLASEAEMRGWRAESKAGAQSLLAGVRQDPLPPATALMRHAFAGA
jgi:acetoin:2,6-dichlorophenolindophenol oxidoreductase subunit alpha